MFYYINELKVHYLQVRTHERGFQNDVWGIFSAKKFN